MAVQLPLLRGLTSQACKNRGLNSGTTEVREPDDSEMNYLVTLYRISLMVRT